ncbi:MAG: hypothetical protein A2144_10115 [Chloroflexi bacterium RBG_16_50_9]|nr:MAG: hypothetical protein A2144_10115 [Chloroflexi bacterium RBG_16_50_9]
MSKFLRIDTYDMDYLKRKAIPYMIFSSPNEVLRFILDLPEKRESKQTREELIKIRVDDEVKELLEARAKQLNIGIRPLHRLLEKSFRLKDADKDRLLPCRPTKKRPRTR